MTKPIVLVRPLSILGVPTQQLPSTLNYIDDNFDSISANEAELASFPSTLP